MSERFHSLNTEHINRESRELLGEKRLASLSVFSTEEYLQRFLDVFKDNPNVVTNNSSIGGGNSLVQEYRAVIEIQVPEITPDRIPRISALYTFFRIGFGIVENIVVDHYIEQADPAQITPGMYKLWLRQPQEERAQEVKAYLSAQDADMLALNLFESEREGTIINYAKGLTVSTARVTGEAPYVVYGGQDSEAQDQMREGVLAAMYLLREHYIGQNVSDANALLEFRIPELPESEAPPGHYLG